MPLSTTSRRQAAVQINKSIRKSKHKESEILKKEFSDVFGIIIDSAKDIPMIPTTLTDRTETPRSDDGLFFYSPNLAGTPLSDEDLFFNSRNVAASLHNDMQKLSWEGLGKLYEWSDMYEAHRSCWGFTTAWTTSDLTALALTIHSRSAMNNEILTTEFIAFYRLAFMAWRIDDSIHQQIETEMMEKQSPQSCASRLALRRLPIRLISIHNHNIRILSTIITEEYFYSFKKDSPSSSSKLHVHIKSISVADYTLAEMKDLAKELLNTKEQVGPLEAIHILP
ncbi:hypothetical protein OCU04_010472 [Sclerotinia nivalis]|uniref:Uncharacterized protein n=1 Tax=Sclerotinia nivalis TaxID=352851 RepID=A0A9X0AFT4_9HELO|nr:hypothetical protein OCU04_010472 [Sclerotinia nivalis]